MDSSAKLRIRRAGPEIRQGRDPKAHASQAVEEGLSGNATIDSRTEGQKTAQNPDPTLSMSSPDPEGTVSGAALAALRHAARLTLPVKTSTEAISPWATTCFASGPAASTEQVRAVVREAYEAARSDFDAASAREWANGYTFPDSYVVSDTRCLRAAQLHFTSMIRRRLKILSPVRLSKERVERLREDNPERTLMFDLADGIRVQPQSPLHPTYESVSTAVDKMLGAVV